MKQKPRGALPKPSSRDAGGETSKQERDGLINGEKNKNVAVKAERSSYVIMILFFIVVYGGLRVYQYQFENLPLPLTLEQVGKRGFSEHEAMKHVEALTRLGPHPVGSDALEGALLYVKEAAELVKKNAHWEVDVEVDAFHVNYGANNLIGGLFKGKTLVYSDLNHIVLRITPKYASEASENAILVSSHIDTVFTGEGAGDCSSCIAVMLELARGVSHSAHGFKNAVIFLFNTGEEEGLNGAHSFMTQHPWSDSVRIAIDLEAIGIGGKSSIFQTGPNPWAIEKFAEVAKYPSAQIVAEDLFTSGAIKSGTDFQVYNELGGLSGLDFAFSDYTAVYHTKNDKLKLLRPGSLQHLGENMLAFLKHAASSSSLPKETRTQSTDDKAIYFDIMGTYLIVFRQRFANMLYNSLTLQSLLIWSTSIFMGGFSALTALALSLLSIILMWVFSIGFSAAVAFVIPIVSSSPVPLVASPWLAVGLFAAPALLGALTGQHLGFVMLNSYLHRAYVVRRRNVPENLLATLAKLEAERWLYKGGLLQWFVLLIAGSYYKIGSTYLAFAWLVSPAFAYGLLEATLSPSRLPRQLKTATLVIGLFVPFVLSSGMVIRLSANIIGTTVRFVRNPGTVPDWLGNVIVAIFIAAIICLTMVYLLSYIHISGAKVPLIFTTGILFALSLGAVWTGSIPPFTHGVARAVNVVHVVDARSESLEPKSFISLFSTTPGNLIKEADQIDEGFVCGRDKYLDFVTFYANYSCWTKNNARIGWTKSDIPQIRVLKDTKEGTQETLISIDTKASTRWSLAVNTQEIEDFRLKDADGDEELIPLGEKSNVDGWHTVQFSGGKNTPTKFNLYLLRNSQTRNQHGTTNRDLLRLRTDVDRRTRQVETVLEKLPPWCSLFGKSTSPRTLAFLVNLPVESLLNNAS